ncbi:MAG: TetR family transcriptional regulator [Polyangiaceae bacterium]|nr:TetR family transcriptional regulator [Polyangiaceae bacterium]
MSRSKNREPLTREAILTAALRLVDDEGLAALSMRRVGDALGVEAMSLYNHVPSKAALLDGLYERIVSGVLPARKARSWRDHLRHQAAGLRAALALHPHAIPIFAARPAVNLGALRRLEGNLAVLREAGFSPMASLQMVQIVFAYVVGHALWSLSPRTDAVQVNYTELDPQELRHVREAAEGLSAYDAEAEFALGLDALLRGFADAP